MKDWETNFSAIVNGESIQYEIAVDQGVQATVLYENIEFTGHSLGGGLASASALATDGKATTFNAAGLTNKLKTNLGIEKGISDNIRAYITRGEFVDFNQRLLGVRAEGQKIIIPARYNILSTTVRQYQRIRNHMIGNHIKRLKKEFLK
ncbi:hypothetical protein [Winogradskyella sp.]|uniref:hypothetical protein n=1 Tax=Winogradskyella sp. TaxID=1883156 RepID=UPI002609A80A|nr:hypothetical protein [Winogradskyella sp.]